MGVGGSFQTGNSHCRYASLSALQQGLLSGGAGGGLRAPGSGDQVPGDRYPGGLLQNLGGGGGGVGQGAGGGVWCLSRCCGGGGATGGGGAWLQLRQETQRGRGRGIGVNINVIHVDEQHEDPEHRSETTLAHLGY